MMPALQTDMFLIYNINWISLLIFRCLVSQDPYYQIFATCSTFYVPLVAILILYWRIYQVARNRIRKKPGHAIRPITTLPLVCESTSFNGSALMVRLTFHFHKWYTVWQKLQNFVTRNKMILIDKPAKKIYFYRVALVLFTIWIYIQRVLVSVSRIS